MENYFAIKKERAPASVAQWIECRLANQRVAGSIPGQGMFRAHTWVAGQLMFLLYLFLPPFPSLYK